MSDESSSCGLHTSGCVLTGLSLVFMRHSLGYNLSIFPFSLISQAHSPSPSQENCTSGDLAEKARDCTFLYLKDNLLLRDFNPCPFIKRQNHLSQQEDGVGWGTLFYCRALMLFAKDLKSTLKSVGLRTVGNLRKQILCLLI